LLCGTGHTIGFVQYNYFMSILKTQKNGDEQS
jgi:hypothetical protein